MQGVRRPVLVPGSRGVRALNRSQNGVSDGDMASPKATVWCLGIVFAIAGSTQAEAQASPPEYRIRDLEIGRGGALKERATL